MLSTLRQFDSWETTLGPRLILGLWHPKFVFPALSVLPGVKRCFIGVHFPLAMAPIFWDSCHAFSIAFPLLRTAEGAAFRKRCRKEDKELYTWTVNSQEEWVMSARWGVDAIMTDKPDAYIQVRQAMKGTHLVTPMRIPPEDLINNRSSL